MSIDIFKLEAEDTILGNAIQIYVNEDFTIHSVNVPGPFDAKVVVAILTDNVALIGQQTTIEGKPGYKVIRVVEMMEEEEIPVITAAILRLQREDPLTPLSVLKPVMGLPILPKGVAYEYWMHADDKIVKEIHSLITH